MLFPSDVARLRGEFDPTTWYQMTWSNFFGRKNVKFHRARGELEVDQLVDCDHPRATGILLLIVERLDVQSTEAVVGFLQSDRHSRNGPRPVTARVPINDVHPHSHGGPDHEVATRS